MKAVNNYKKLYKEERRKILHLGVQINQMKSETEAKINQMKSEMESEIESLKKYFLAIIEHLEKKNDELQRRDNYHDVYNTPQIGTHLPVNNLENYDSKTINPQVKSRAANLVTRAPPASST